LQTLPQLADQQADADHQGSAGQQPKLAMLHGAAAPTNRGTVVMTERHQDIAAKIVEQFRADLSEGVRQHIDSEHFERLASLICMALSGEQAVAIELVEAALVKLRLRMDAPPLEL
jgi:hypothetical protein